MPKEKIKIKPLIIRIYQNDSENNNDHDVYIYNASIMLHRCCISSILHILKVEKTNASALKHSTTIHCHSNRPLFPSFPYFPILIVS